MNTRKPPVQLRPDSALDTELTTRSSSEMPSARNFIAARDLERYYALLTASLPKFSQSEAMLIADALNGSLNEVHSMRLLWASIQEAIEYDGLDQKWGVDGAALVARLRALSLAEVYAVTDAIERAWIGRDGTMPERLAALGLISSETTSEK
jgi:hypothetical protein